jgi:hypothetical protein
VRQSTAHHDPLLPIGLPALPVAVARPIAPTPAARERLKKMAYGHKAEHRLRMRAQVVLHAARGRSKPTKKLSRREMLSVEGLPVRCRMPPETGRNAHLAGTDSKGLVRARWWGGRYRSVRRAGHGHGGRTADGRRDHASQDADGVHDRGRSPPREIAEFAGPPRGGRITGEVDQRDHASVRPGVRHSPCAPAARGSGTRVPPASGGGRQPAAAVSASRAPA